MRHPQLVTKQHYKLRRADDALDRMSGVLETICLETVLKIVIFLTQHHPGYVWQQLLVNRNNLQHIIGHNIYIIDRHYRNAGFGLTH